MQLPAVDAAYLRERGIVHQIASEAGMTCVVIVGWPLPPGYDRTSSDLLLRLAPGYPDVPPDMWWFDPAVHFADGKSPPATEVVEAHLGRRWQRWSRHLDPGRWHPGSDSLESFLALVRADLARAGSARAA